jgi:hypothetical protein
MTGPRLGIKTIVQDSIGESCHPNMPRSINKQCHCAVTSKSTVLELSPPVRTNTGTKPKILRSVSVRATMRLLRSYDGRCGVRNSVPENNRIAAEINSVDGHDEGYAVDAHAVRGQFRYCGRKRWDSQFDAWVLVSRTRSATIITRTASRSTMDRIVASTADLVLRTLLLLGEGLAIHFQIFERVHLTCDLSLLAVRGLLGSSKMTIES